MQPRFRSTPPPRIAPPPSFRPMQGGGGAFGPPRMARPPQMRQGGKPGGGLLSKLLGKGGSTGGAQQGMNAMRGIGNAPSAAGGGGILKSLTNPASINGFLANTQKVLNTAQQIGPMVNQYGPLVKNIPAMWKLYRGLKSMPDADNSNEKPVAEEHTTKQETKQKKAVAIETEAISETTERKTKQPSSSVPKLYI